jgi:hypothetical protein
MRRVAPMYGGKLDDDGKQKAGNGDLVNVD